MGKITITGCVEDFSIGETVAVLSVTLLVGMFSAFYNALLVFIYFTKTEKRHPTDLYIANVCISDIVLTIVLLPLVTYNTVFGSIGSDLCLILILLDNWLCYVSVYTLTLRTVDICATVKQLCKGKFVKLVREHVKYFVVGIWVFSGFFAVLPFLVAAFIWRHENVEEENSKHVEEENSNNVQEENSNHSAGASNETESCPHCLPYRDFFWVEALARIVVFFVPFTFCLINYISVIYPAWKMQQVQTDRRASWIKVLEAPEDERMDKERSFYLHAGVGNIQKAHKGIWTMRNYYSSLSLLGMKLFFFYLCWTPFFFKKIHLVVTRGKEEVSSLHEVFLISFLPFLSAAINPVLYGIISKHGRTAANETLEEWYTFCCPRWNKQVEAGLQSVDLVNISLDALEELTQDAGGRPFGTRQLPSYIAQTVY
jgi:hypothetical protein